MPSWRYGMLRWGHCGKLAGLKPREWFVDQDSARLATPIFPTGMTAESLGYVPTGGFPVGRLSRVTMLGDELTMGWGRRSYPLGSLIMWPALDEIDWCACSFIENEAQNQANSIKLLNPFVWVVGNYRDDCGLDSTRPRLGWLGKASDGMIRRLIRY